MGSIKVTESIKAPVDVVFGYVDDYKNTTKYMKDLTLWEPVGSLTHGKGAVFEVAMKAGPKSLESTVDITAWTENKTIAWVSSEGFTQKGRWTFASKGSGTEATFELDYDLGGGIAGKMLAKVAEPVVRMNIVKSVENLKLQTEKLAAKGAAKSSKAAAAKPAPAKASAAKRSTASKR